MNRIITLIFYILAVSGYAQVLTKSAEYTIASSNIETTQQILSLPVGKEHFISLNKTKGSQLSPSSFLLQKYDMNLAAVFSTPLTIDVNEDYKEIHVVENEIYLFSEKHDIFQKKKALKVYVFNLETGVLKSDKIINEQTVAAWLEYPSKGATKETYELAISSNLTYNFNTPLEYQYTIQFSPDKKTILVYTFDYSQKTLIATTIILDTKLNVLQDSKVSVDNNFINYGIFVNNKQELHILNCDKLGRIVLVRFNPVTRDMIFLDVQSTISKREGLKLQFFNDDEIYVANVITSNKKFSGIMYSKFNFRDRIVEKLNIHDLSEGLLQTSKAVHTSTKLFSSEENWMNYQIADFRLNEYEKIVLVLEKRNLEVIGYQYESSSVNDIKNWMVKLGKVHVESVIMMAFNKDDQLLWENYYAKNQVNDITGGTLHASYSMDISDEGKIRMVYASSDNATGVYNLLKYVEWDELSGSKVKDLSLSNDDGLVLLRNYTLWWESKLVLVGKKGILGKKTMVHTYDLASK
ncbi:hypothetical protein [Cytophaga aurantiaca]|uniref:hypothetical protein n=1 Tax=Cytophaga aurantiaca TaxID=29530 RepID=UPI00036CC2B8|nr:hypothetical protein [Cytophaga aurantiaca]